MKKTIFSIVLLSLTTVGLADNCSRPKNTFDSLYCARKIFFSLDDDLNVTYKKLRDKLNTVGKERLKSSQLDWIHERNTVCVNGDSVNVSCAVEKTRSRLYFLKDRLHECSSVGCINDKL